MDSPSNNNNNNNNNKQGGVLSSSSSSSSSRRTMRKWSSSCFYCISSLLVLLINKSLVVYGFPIVSSPIRKGYTLPFTTRIQPLPFQVLVQDTHHEKRILTRKFESDSEPEFSANNDNDDDEEEEEEEEEDWRDFRAKLVMQFQQQQQQTSSSSSPSSSSSSTAMVEEDGLIISSNTDTDQRSQSPPQSIPTSTSSNTKTTNTNTTTHPSPPSSSKSSSKAWAYDSGTSIEKGSIILSRTEQDFGYGLSQQYFHKSVILVLYHEDQVFTKGIILNRPSDLILTDNDFVNEDGTPLEDSSSENKWKVWFGGDVQGIYSEEPEINCLHALKLGNKNGLLVDDDNDDDMDVSEEIIKGIQSTSLEGARKLVKKGLAKPSDFWTFIGYCGWGSGQLADELEREAWYVVAADSKTVLMEMKKNDAGKDPRDCGLETWGMLMDMIGRGDEVSALNSDYGTFDDLMLREWAREILFFGNNNNNASDGDDEKNGMEGDNERDRDDSDELLRNLLSRASTKGKGEVGVGSILRASCLNYHPFLLSDQEYHKSIILIIQDDDEVSIGVILNLPTAIGVNVQILDTNTNTSKDYVIPERYGGRFGVEGDNQKPLFWFHCSEKLRDAGVGSPVGGSDHYNGIWKCLPEDAASAVATGIAMATDFLVISGFSFWEKVGGGVAGGIQGEVWNGIFDVVDASKTRQIWDLLVSQNLLSEENIDENLKISDAAWAICGGEQENIEDTLDSKEFGNSSKRGGEYVFNSDVKVTELANSALRSWVATFLLKDPNIRKT